MTSSVDIYLAKPKMHIYYYRWLPNAEYSELPEYEKEWRKIHRKLSKEYQFVIPVYVDEARHYLTNKKSYTIKTHIRNFFTTRIINQVGFLTFAEPIRFMDRREYVDIYLAKFERVLNMCEDDKEIARFVKNMLTC